MIVNLIYKCKIYANISECKICEDNFYLETPCRCQLVKPI